jgi:hypothetical protein
MQQDHPPDTALLLELQTLAVEVTGRKHLILLSQMSPKSQTVSISFSYKPVPHGSYLLEEIDVFMF